MYHSFSCDLDASSKELSCSTAACTSNSTTTVVAGHSGMPSLSNFNKCDHTNGSGGGNEAKNPICRDFVRGHCKRIFCRVSYGYNGVNGTIKFTRKKWERQKMP